MVRTCNFVNAEMPLSLSTNEISILSNCIFLLQPKPVACSVRHFANVLLFCLFGERAPSYLRPLQARKTELRMQSANWTLFIPAGLAEGGKNIEQRHQRQWMEGIKNFPKSLEEVLTTPIIVCFTCEWGRKCGQRVNAKRAFIHKHEGARGSQRIRLRASPAVWEHLGGLEKEQCAEMNSCGV